MFFFWFLIRGPHHTTIYFWRTRTEFYQTRWSKSHGALTTGSALLLSKRLLCWYAFALSVYGVMQYYFKKIKRVLLFNRWLCWFFLYIAGKSNLSACFSSVKLPTQNISGKRSPDPHSKFYLHVTMDYQRKDV